MTFDKLNFNILFSFCLLALEVMRTSQEGEGSDSCHPLFEIPKVQIHFLEKKSSGSQIPVWDAIFVDRFQLGHFPGSDTKLFRDGRSPQFANMHVWNRGAFRGHHHAPVQAVFVL
jgi:hypothetical protein